MSTDDKVIKDAQYRKGLSIAFFNATNAAMTILSGSSLQGEELKERIVFWRDWLLDEHKKYYSEVIANVGKNYDASKTIERLKSVKNTEELKAAWISLSEDERHDGEIRKVVKELQITLP